MKGRAEKERVCSLVLMWVIRAGRALTGYSFLETPVPPIYQNVNSVYGYVRMRVNATTLITEVGSHLYEWVFEKDKL